METDNRDSDFHPEIVEATATRSLEEVCVSCQVEARWIVDLVEHGALEPLGRTQSEWRFPDVAIVRIAQAKRLERDLSLNLPGVALALDLLDEIADLRRRLKAREQSIR